jgi:hypothetical protein
LFLEKVLHLTTGMQLLNFYLLPKIFTSRASVQFGRVNYSYSFEAQYSYNSFEKFVGAAANRKAIVLFTIQTTRLQNSSASNVCQYSNAQRPNWAFNRTNCGWLRHPQFSG